MGIVRSSTGFCSSFYGFCSRITLLVVDRDYRLGKENVLNPKTDYLGIM